jgi:hypothetical protein
MHSRVLYCAGQLRIELQQKEAENAILTKKLEEAEERERSIE